MGKRKDSSLNDKSFSVYFSRYAHPKEYLGQYSVVKNLSMVITIPCFNEPNLVETLNSLYHCKPTQNPVEIIVLINQSISSSTEVKKQNEKSYNDAKQWAEKHNTQNKQFHTIWVKDIPEKHAGVGQARKIVMDEAIRRLVKSKAFDGIVVGFDADSLCDNNYLFEIEQFFQREPESTGATIYFEHPISINENSAQDLGIASYELHLRYIVQALRYAHFPYAFHTMGSSMAVRATAYVKQGGMNKRKAGEDFYFLHKIIPLGNFSEINTTRVIPSSRTSNRVPFGTGKAMMKWSESKSLQFETYNPKIFEELRSLYYGINELAGANDIEIAYYHTKLAPCLKKFLQEDEWLDKIRHYQHQSNSVQIFRYRFFQWMDGLKTLKFIHFARDKMYGNVPVTEAYTWLRKKIVFGNSKKNDVFKGLAEVRFYDKSNTYEYNKSSAILKNHY